uniref:Uncharacterized protein n=1 Tax=Anguilla anguilla TaxID=7936 RepID=A0A0E9P6I7_ANGAN
MLAAVIQPEVPVFKCNYPLKYIL